MSIKPLAVLISVLGIAFVLVGCGVDSQSYNPNSGDCKGYNQTTTASLPNGGNLFVNVTCQQNNGGNALKFVFGLNNTAITKGFHFRNADLVDTESYTGESTTAIRTLIYPNGKHFQVVANLPIA